MDLTYIRATENEANVDLDQQDTFKDFAIQIDQTIINVVQSEFGNYSYREFPIEILFISANLTTDDKLQEVDEWIDAMEEKADTFYDKLIQSDIVDKNVVLPGYQLDRLSGYKRFDTVLSGVQFTMDVPIPRLKYYCNGS